MPMNILYNVTYDQFKTDLDASTGSFTGDPGLTPYFKVIAAAANNSLVATVRFHFTISIWAMCYDRTNLMITGP